jgi:hypothetical protein
MDSVFNVLSSVKDSIILVIDELDKLNQIKDIGIKKLPLYIETVSTLQSSIINLENIFEDDIPIQHKLKRLVILSLKIDLDEFKKSLQECKLWHDKIITQEEEQYMKRLNNCSYNCININLCNIELITSFPSEILEKIETIFQIINEKIQDVIILEKTIFGTAISIKNPLLQKVWMNCGLNQLNDSEIPINLIIESLYNMWCIEEGGKLHNNKTCIELITNFVNSVDNLSGTSANGMISVQELNEIPINEKNTKSIKGLLGIPHQPIYKKIKKKKNNEKEILSNEIHVRFKESSLFLENKEKYSELIINFVNDLQNKNNEYSNEKINKEVNNIQDINNKQDNDTKEIANSLEEEIQQNIVIDISFTSLISISSSHSINIPACNGYGNNWPSILATEIIVPKIDSINNNVFSGIELIFNATDQGWGGTGHSNIRYQINDSKNMGSIFIDRDKNKENLYSIIIPPSNINSNDKILIWLSCPPWNGWEATINSIKGILKFN